MGESETSVLELNEKIVSLDKKEIRNAILEAEEHLRGMVGSKTGKEFDEVCPLVHKFVDGAYVREIFMPKGVFVTSKIHKICHPYFVMKGDCSVLTDEGVVRIKAPYSGITQAGTKRILYMHEDTTWITVHVTEHTDLEKIEDEIIAKSFDELDNILPTEEEIKILTEEKFSIDDFRELTKVVIKEEKVGFWSDFTKEQQDLYTNSDWKAFSTSRGYTESEINNYEKWLAMTDMGIRQGHNVYELIIDLTMPAYEENIKRDTKGEIALTSHLPKRKKMEELI